MQPNERFTDRVENYVRYRPRYPQGVIELLREEAGLVPGTVVADLGSGTGISAELFLENGNEVYAVEPNEAMRQAAEARLASNPRFHSIAGSAEATTLPEGSVHMVVAAQAFHWFDAGRTREECRRILRPGGVVVLMWNSRKTDTTLFLRAYEELLLQHGTDYRNVRHENITDARLTEFFGGEYRLRVLENRQRFGIEGLKGRLLSSSYVPAEGEPGCSPLLQDLERIFEEHAEDGEVIFEYATEVYWR